MYLFYAAIVNIVTLTTTCMNMCYFKGVSTVLHSILGPFKTLVLVPSLSPVLFSEETGSCFLQKKQTHKQKSSNKPTLGDIPRSKIQTD